MIVEGSGKRDAFALRERALKSGDRLGGGARQEVRANAQKGIEPLLHALRQGPEKVVWIASCLAAPPFLALLVLLDRRAPLELDVVAPFGDDCFPDAASRGLTSILGSWSKDWHLQVLEGPTYPGHVFLIDGRILLCRDPLLTPNPVAPDWVHVELAALPSLERRLRRRRAACRVLGPSHLEGLEPGDSVVLPELPLVSGSGEERRLSRIADLLGVPR